MAGLPCEECRAPMVVIPSGSNVEDAARRVMYRRHRVCINPECSLYLIQRETFEVMSPLALNAPLVSTTNSKLRHLKLPPRNRELPHQSFRAPQRDSEKG